MSREEIKKQHINNLQEKYNILYLEYKELKERYEMLVHRAVETVFDEYNDDVELLARYLYKLKEIDRTDTEWVNPLYEDPYYRKIEEIEPLEE